MKRFGVRLDIGDVRPFQVIVYLAYIIAGIQSFVLGAPPNAVAQAMGDSIALVWAVLVIVCPLLTLAGIYAERRSFGLHMQAAGDSGVAFATAAYVVAVLQATWWDRATFAAWMAASLGLCAALMTWRDIRRILFVQRRVLQIEGDSQ